MYWNNLRVGKKYRLTNMGDVYDFQVVEIFEDDFKVKDMNTLDYFYLSETIAFGKGPDYDLYEL
ncbi:MAG: hypothetical protein LAT68_01235 [Cyclobacteriaceae bacterium]|nr:hypothetical protein [Cyclobacteriaceae bacterium]MCH8514926.1 hypothetical protein [Cyclobacteriaceae bacterium]